MRNDRHGRGLEGVLGDGSMASSCEERRGVGGWTRSPPEVSRGRGGLGADPRLCITEREVLYVIPKGRVGPFSYPRGQRLEESQSSRSFTGRALLISAEGL